MRQNSAVWLCCVGQYFGVLFISPSFVPSVAPPIFPLFPLEWHFQLSESTPTPPPRDLLSSLPSSSSHFSAKSVPPNGEIMKMALADELQKSPLLHLHCHLFMRGVVALLFPVIIFAKDTFFPSPMSHAIMFHKRPRVVSHFDFWYVVSDAADASRRSLVVAGMGKKSLIKSGDAVLSPSLHQKFACK